ncbi:MAG: hypothetical protein ABIR21_11830 [Chthoniobacterales bacterium]
MLAIVARVPNLSGRERRTFSPWKGKLWAWSVVALLSWTFNAEAIILFRTADPAANTTAPTGELLGSGWQFQGRFGDFLGTPIAPRFLITAHHIGGAANFFYRGATYTLLRSFPDPASDLSIWEVAETFPEYAQLYARSDEVGKRMMMIGRGTQRGAERFVQGEMRGWEWGATDRVQRWGENEVAAITSGGSLVQGLFDQAGLPNESTLSAGDSGGALFLPDGGVWKLAGIHYDVDMYSSGPGGGGYAAALFDQRGSYLADGTLVTGNAPVPQGLYATRISSRIDWIIGTIAPRLVNLSARSTVGGGDQVSIGGFIIQGAPGQSRRVAIRGLGPSLQVNGAPVQGRLIDPVLELHGGNGATISTNDNWAEMQASEIQGSGLAPSDAREATIIATLAPGNYTTVLRGKDGGTGVGLVEVYDLDATLEARVGNLSARSFVGMNDQVLIGGLIVRSVSQRLLLRALGPSLAAQGVSGGLANPTLEFRDANGALRAANDNWQDAPNRNEITATGIAPNDTREAAILLVPGPGSFTAVVRGAGETTGVALLEAYLLD